MIELDIRIFADKAVHLWVHLLAAAALRCEEQDDLDRCQILAS